MNYVSLRIRGHSITKYVDSKRWVGSWVGGQKRPVLSTFRVEIVYVEIGKVGVSKKGKSLTT